MSKRSGNFHQPLKNITASFNSIMSDSGFSNLTNSPMSNLVFNLSELSTGRNTPKLRRKLSLSSVDTPPNGCGKNDQDSSHSAESGCFSESPLDDSPTLQSLSVKRYTTALHPEIPLEAFSIKKRTIAFRRINSQPLPAMRLDSPTDFLEEDKGEHDDDDGDVRNEYEHDETITSENEENVHYRRNKLFSDDAISQDSGLGLESDRVSQRSSVSSFDDVGSSSSSSLNQMDRLPSLEDVWNSIDSPSFKTPKGMPPKRSRSMIDDKQYSEDTCSPIKYSPVKSSIPRPSFSKALFCQIPESVNETSEASKFGADDGFQELFKLDHLNYEADAKASSLISATLLHRAFEDKPDEFAADMQVTFKKAENETPSSRPANARRGLYRSQSLNIRPRQSFKRCEPPSDDTSPVQCKRWRGEEPSTKAARDIIEENNKMVLGNRRLQRCHSETETIKSAVSRMLSEPDLIGDCSKAYCLPTVSGKHQDLKSISPETLRQLMASEYSDVEEFHIIDCRYPYEYEGGHIQNALNIYTKDEVFDKYMKSPLCVKDPSKRIILVFHCEFSSERGPGLFRFLRRQDREANEDFYPFLHYPEIYLLEGGYKSFFEKFAHLCEPRNYKTMLDKNHMDDLRKFRTKSKSWLDEKSQPRSGVRNLKF